MIRGVIKSSRLKFVQLSKLRQISGKIRHFSASRFISSDFAHTQKDYKLSKCAGSIQFRKFSSSLKLLTSSVKATMKPEFERLPKYVTPSHYELQLQPDLVNFVFAGTSKTSIKISHETDKITLNSVDLKIQKAIVRCDGTSIFESIETIYLPESEVVNILFGKQLPVTQNAVLELEFTGELNDKMKGFYRSKYFTSTGEERFAGVTQFEATDARRCFPCWDEPAIKATFDITLIIPQDRVGLSNMPVVKEENLDNNLKLLKFDRSPIMSTYLVAVVVGEYDYVEARSDDGVLVRVYTPVGKKEQGQFALEVTTKVLPYYKDYFQIAYPLPKMDLITISDFSAGAMENWGLVTYRETMVLVDPENTSLIRKQSIALIVGHEIAHQWFGNLVTMEWWTDLWLNEGYASFVEFLCVNHLFPEYDIWTQFVTDMYTPALDADCLNNSHPIEVPVGHPSEIDEIFDEISYNKGASVIRMLHHYLGDEDFRKGMNHYLTKYQYQNTVTENLWSSLEQASSKPVTDIMRTWIKKMGFPVVKITKNVQEKNGRRLTLEQTKFTADGSIDDKSLWMIPINISTAKSANAYTTVLDKKEMEVLIEGVTDKDWIKINPDTIGYYRTQYPSQMLEQFIPAIKNMSLPPLDRLGLHDDLFALVQNGSSSTVDSLKLIDAYRSENNYTVWSSIATSLSKLKNILSHTDLSDQFNSYGIQLFGPIAQQLGWDAKSKESHLDTLLRSLVISRLVSFNCQQTCDEAKRRFYLHKEGKQTLPADLRMACYRALLQSANTEVYEEMLNLYRATDLHEEKDRISRALGSIKDFKLLQKVLQFAMSDEVRAQDAVFVIASVAINPIGRDLSWKFLAENQKVLVDQYQGGFLLTRLVKHLTENFASAEKALEVENFFKTNHFPGTERTVQQSIETIKLNAAWLKRDLANIKEFLKIREIF
ncbi:CLUMA_CG016271, isoform A [Clunio marinus]|uniref:Aminopeptidase n=1 Tax=Clunio marinus TaxID=568069 RepID=A0A1J1ITI4_9DIPT|nr:CLUMA_CG016271, isoform A [Clunio marinus]